jgi:hypothetical protein
MFVCIHEGMRVMMLMPHAMCAYACMHACIYASMSFRLLTCTQHTHTYMHAYIHENRLEFVHGYDASATSNVCMLKSGEILYSVAALCVVLNLSAGRRTQRIFTKHTRKCHADDFFAYKYVYSKAVKLNMSLLQHRCDATTGNALFHIKLISVRICVCMIYIYIMCV